MSLLIGIVGAGLTTFTGTFSATLSFIKGDWQGGMDTLVATQRAALDSILRGLGTSLDEIEALFKSGVAKLKTAGANLINAIKDGIAGAISGVLAYIEEQAGKITAALSNIRLPSWLIPGSPTPFELGLRGIADAMREVGNTAPVTFGNLAPSLSAPALAGVGALAGQGGGGAQLTQYNTVRDNLDIEAIAYRVIEMIDLRRP